MENKIAIIGCGSMGKMLLEKIINSKIIPEDNLFVANRTLEKVQVLKEKYNNIHICRTNKEAAENSDIIFICVRPSDIKTVLLEIIDVLDNSKHIISLNGSVLFEQIETVCKNNKISKVIPSVTAEVDESQTLVCHNSKVTEEDKIVLNKILPFNEMICLLLSSTSLISSRTVFMSDGLTQMKIMSEFSAASLFVLQICIFLCFSFKTCIFSSVRFATNKLSSGIILELIIFSRSIFPMLPQPIIAIFFSIIFSCPFLHSAPKASS